MGIVNVTPDSFSDGGRFLRPEVAIRHGLALVEAGADLLDVGGESTRPGAEPVGAAEELRRVIPVVEGLAEAGVTISVDTAKAEVARAALDAGAGFVNDVTALRGDPAMSGLLAERDAPCCLMHMLGEPRTMQDHPRYGDVVSDVRAFLEERLAVAVDAGIAEERIHLDPGIGFGKTVEHNLELIRRLDEIAAVGRPVVIGLSRKAFLGKISGRPVDQREVASAAANVLAYERGARIFRVHDVAATRDALAIAAATVAGAWAPTTPRTTSSTPT
jgi:dihydropteroate synthase